MASKKIGIITQARMGSSRLPGKILAEVQGVPLLEYHLRRLIQSQVPVIVATTVSSSDNAVATFCENRPIPFFRGSELDVLERYYKTAKKFQLDIIVRVTSDCPLIDGDLIAQGLRLYTEANDRDLYLSNCQKRSFPRGMDFEIFSFEMLKDAFEYAKTPAEREHVTPYLWNNKNGSYKKQDFINAQDLSKYRLTVDEPKDFELISKLISEYACDKMSCQSIVDILVKNPKLAAINQFVEQKKVE